MSANFNVSPSPHIRDRVKSSNIMLFVVIALLPATFFGIYNFRHENAWLLVLVTTASAVLAEYIYEKLMHKPVTIQDFSAVVTGLLLALNLPPTLPLWMGALGSVFAIIVVKQLFGGLCNSDCKTTLWRVGTEFYESGTGSALFSFNLVYRENDVLCI